MDNQYICTQQIECPRHNNPWYEGRCVDGQIQPGHRSPYQCPDCGGNGYISVVSRADLVELIKEVITEFNVTKELRGLD